ncbi:MAG: hypothetical protein MHPSP_002433, partial [Paramarteilia canceri]
NVHFLTKLVPDKQISVYKNDRYLIGDLDAFKSFIQKLFKQDLVVNNRFSDNMIKSTYETNSKITQIEEKLQTTVYFQNKQLMQLVQQLYINEIFKGQLVIKPIQEFSDEILSRSVLFVIDDEYMDINLKNKEIFKIHR